MKNLRIQPLREAEAPGWQETKAPFICFVVLGIISIGIILAITIINFIRSNASASTSTSRNEIHSLRVSYRRTIVPKRPIQSLAK